MKKVLFIAILTFFLSFPLTLNAQRDRDCCRGSGTAYLQAQREAERARAIEVFATGFSEFIRGAQREKEKREMKQEIERLKEEIENLKRQ